MTILTEAASLAPENLTGKSWRVKVLEGDRQGSSAFYPKEVLEAGRTLFAKGTRVYADHPSDGERPERSINKLIGWFTEDATYDGKDLFSSVQFVEGERERIKELAEAGVIGLSIRAEGKFKPGTKHLAQFTKVHSVDVVTVPGAGGAFTQMLESESGSDGTGVPGSQEESMDPKELAEAVSTALAEKFDALLEALKPAPAAPAEPVAPVTESEKAPLKDVLKATADLTEAGREAVVEVYEAGGDWAAKVEAEKARDAEIRESAKTEFKGSVALEESGKDALEAAIAGVFRKA